MMKRPSLSSRARYSRNYGRKNADVPRRSPGGCECAKTEALPVSSEDWYRAIFEASADAHLLFGEQGFLDCNQAAVKFLRVPDKEQLKNCPPSTFFPERQACGTPSVELSHSMEAIAKEKGQHRFPWLHRRYDNTVFASEVTLTPVRLPSEDALLVVWRDLSAEEAQEERLRLLSSVAEFSTSSIIITDVSQKILFVNPAFEKLTGYVASEAAGKVPGHMLRGPASLSNARKAIAEALAERKPVVTEQVNYRKDGSLYWIELNIAPVFDGDGTCTHYVCIGNDITHRKLQEAALKQSQERQAFALLAAQQGLWDWNPETGSLIIDDRWAEIIGYRREELKNELSSFTDHVLPDDLEAGWAAMQRYLHGVNDKYEMQFRMQHRNGSVVWIQSQAQAVERNEEGKPCRVVGTHIDITERKLAEQQLKDTLRAAETAARVKSDFLATMSHEIRTPMNGVIGMAGLLSDTELSPIQREYAGIIRSSAESLLTIINDILDFSKIEAGKLEIERLCFDPELLAEEALELALPLVGNKTLDLSFQCNGLPGAMWGDPTRIRQVLLNLLTNAIKFTEKGQVRLHVYTAGQQKMRWEISDTGIGISPEAQNRLFSAFTQADIGTTRRFGGTGLGLAICKRLIEFMGGEIGVTSEVGQGSCFWFTLPCEPAAGKNYAPVPTLAGKEVLVIADSAEVRSTLDRHLTGMGAKTVFANTSLEALNILNEREAPFSAALIEFEMPILDGLTILRAIRRKESPDELPVVLIVNPRSKPQVEAAIRLKFQWIVTKPIRGNSMLRALNAVFSPQIASPRAPVKEQYMSQVMAKILVVEDNLVNQKLTMALLQKRGYQATVVGNGEEAVAIVQKQQFDLILMDCQMPIMDGFEATRRIRALDNGAETIPIVALTAGVLFEEKEQCLQAGMNDFLSKPIRVERLDEILVLFMPRRNFGELGPVPRRNPWRI